MAEQQPDVTAAQLAALYDAKAVAELADAEAQAGGPACGWRGEPLSRLAFVVSAMSPDDVAAGGPLSGEAGDAAGKAAAALGVDSDVFVVASRPTAALAPQARSSRLVLALEAADPQVVIALDTDAAADLADAYGLEPLVPGRAARARGRVLGSAGDFVASLGDEKAKARVWGAMKAVAADGGLKAAGRPKAPR
jgi:hypothetical protein